MEGVGEGASAQDLGVYDRREGLNPGRDHVGIPLRLVRRRTWGPGGKFSLKPRKIAPDHQLLGQAQRTWREIPGTDQPLLNVVETIIKHLEGMRPFASPAIDETKPDREQTHPGKHHEPAHRNGDPRLSHHCPP